MTDITILTPSYRYGRFISDAIKSVTNQRGVRSQHVVQDALSDDETPEILQSFEDRIEWTSERDIGQSDGLNRSLAKAKGTWIGWLNADEYYLPDGLMTLKEEGEKVGADVVYGDSVAVDRLGRLLDLRPQHSFSSLILRLYGPFLDSVAVIMRRSILEESPWDPALRVVMDWDLYLGLASRGASFRYVPYPVGAFRRHADQASSQPHKTETKHVRQRYGIPTGRPSRRAATALHRVRKLAAGSYSRQLRARPLRGRDLRWFEEGDGSETFRLVLDRCYGLKVSRS